jgi:hypothetical protein
MRHQSKDLNGCHSCTTQELVINRHTKAEPLIQVGNNNNIHDDIQLSSEWSVYLFLSFTVKDHFVIAMFTNLKAAIPPTTQYVQHPCAEGMKLSSEYVECRLLGCYAVWLLLRTSVSEERSPSIIRVTSISVSIILYCYFNVTVQTV